MKPLIEIDSSLYRKRLAKELNKEENGFYVKIGPMIVRGGRARIKDDHIQCYDPVQGWFEPDSQNFTDPYGREIVASRVP